MHRPTPVPDQPARPRRQPGARGAALVELALVLPLLLLIMVGTIDFGRAFRTAMVVTNAARAGAQYGSQYYSATDTAGMVAASDAVLTANGLSSGPPSDASTLCQCADSLGNFSDTAPVNTCTAPTGVSLCPGKHLVMRVTVRATRTFSLIQPFPALPGSVTIARAATMRAQ